MPRKSPVERAMSSVQALLKKREKENDWLR
jgi:hypothetical protein